MRVAASAILSDRRELALSGPGFIMTGDPVHPWLLWFGPAEERLGRLQIVGVRIRSRPAAAVDRVGWLAYDQRIEGALAGDLRQTLSSGAGRRRWNTLSKMNSGCAPRLPSRRGSDIPTVIGRPRPTASVRDEASHDASPCCEEIGEIARRFLRPHGRRSGCRASPRRSARHGQRTAA